MKKEELAERLYDKNNDSRLKRIREGSTVALPRTNLDTRYRQIKRYRSSEEVTGSPRTKSETVAPLRRGQTVAPKKRPELKRQSSSFYRVLKKIGSQLFGSQSFPHTFEEKLTIGEIKERYHLSEEELEAYHDQLRTPDHDIH